MKKSNMMRWRRAAPKASLTMGALAQQSTDITKSLPLSAGAQKETIWNKVEAAKAFEASRQKFEVEKYRALMRRY